MLLYPRRVRREVRGDFDIYHVVDHSYAQLALDLPGASTIVTCHDVDAFRGLVQPDHTGRWVALRMLSARILRGLQRVRFVVCGSAAARDDLVRFNLVDPARTRLVPNGIDPGLLHEASPSAQEQVDRLVPRAMGVADVLHVGSDIPRKRLDRTIRIMAALRSRGHAVRLIRVGAPLRPATRRMAKELGFADYIELPFLERDALRAVYQRAHMLLLTSDREGYGLPIIEAFAAGKPAVVNVITDFKARATTVRFSAYST
jgi:glycosyltransferase involved in cell wall biosynthesis